LPEENDTPLTHTIFIVDVCGELESGGYDAPQIKFITDEACHEYTTALIAYEQNPNYGYGQSHDECRST
jgi:hypothetical protein